jgi:hypothetical protein
MFPLQKRVHSVRESGQKEGILMPQAKEHTAEEIIPKLRTAELEIAKGCTAAEAAKKTGVNENFDSHWPLATFS